MKRIGILGAGRSAGFLIEYLGDYCSRVGVELFVYDLDFQRNSPFRLGLFDIGSSIHISI